MFGPRFNSSIHKLDVQAKFHHSQAPSTRRDGHLCKAVHTTHLLPLAGGDRVFLLLTMEAGGQRGARQKWCLQGLAFLRERILVSWQQWVLTKRIALCPLHPAVPNPGPGSTALANNTGTGIAAIIQMKAQTLGKNLWCISPKTLPWKLGLAVTSMSTWPLGLWSRKERFQSYTFKKSKTLETTGLLSY